MDIYRISYLCDIFLLAAIFSSIAEIKKDPQLKYREAIYYIVPVVLSLYLYYYKGLFFLDLATRFKEALQILIILGIFGLLKIKKNSEERLYLALSAFLFSAILSFFSQHKYMTEVYIAFRIGGYFLFYNYFSRIVHQRYLNKVEETENLKSSLERALNVEVKKRMYAIEKSNERLLEMSKTDLMTKAYNKITILNLIEKLISKKDSLFSILMFDIDNFKTINDTLGHVTGDLCLKNLANIASGNIREVDFLGRYGGDEFIIVLPNLSTNEAKYVAERFRSKVNETTNPKFTVSIGIATYPQDGANVKELISAADKGLYRSKSRGRNAVSHYKLF